MGDDGHSDYSLDVDSDDNDDGDSDGDGAGNSAEFSSLLDRMEQRAMSHFVDTTEVLTQHRRSSFSSPAPPTPTAPPTATVANPAFSGDQVMRQHATSSFSGPAPGGAARPGANVAPRPKTPAIFLTNASARENTNTAVPLKPVAKVAARQVAVDDSSSDEGEIEV